METFSVRRNSKPYFKKYIRSFQTCFVYSNFNAGMEGKSVDTEISDTSTHLSHDHKTSRAHRFNNRKTIRSV